MGKILLTGITSFVGIHLANALTKEHEVYATLTKSKGEYSDIQAERLKQADPKIQFVHMDLLESDSINKVMSEVKPEFLIHHAGYTINYGSHDYDLELARKVHVTPLKILLENFKEFGGRGVLMTGTAMEYSDSDDMHFENDEARPSTPYGISKLEQTYEGMSQAKRLELPLRVVRIFNVFGPLENPKKLVPSVVAKLSQGTQMDLSPCTQVRSWDHVNTVVASYLALLDDLSQGGQDVYNATSKHGVSLRKFLEILCEKFKLETELLNFGAMEMRDTEVLRCEASPEKTKSLPGMVQTSLEEELETFANEVKA